MIDVALIGPGRVGTSLARALPASYQVVAVAGRGTGALDRFTAYIPGAAVLPAVDAARHGRLVLVCVPDDALVGCVRDLAANDAVAPGSRWVHTSGGHGLKALRPARLAGAAVAACHPAQTFPDTDAVERLPGTAWAVTAQGGDRGWAAQLVTDLGGRPVDVADGRRTLYHAALALGANATTAVVTLARELLLGAGVPEPEAFLQPLAEAAAAGGAQRGAAALTGPVRRGDAGTVAAHLAELRQFLPEAVEAYVAVSRLALRQARLAGLDGAAADAVEQALDGAAGSGREPGGA